MNNNNRRGSPNQKRKDAGGGVGLGIPSSGLNPNNTDENPLFRLNMTRHQDLPFRFLPVTVEKEKKNDV
jgi:hypothetical protein